MYKNPFLKIIILLGFLVPESFAQVGTPINPVSATLHINTKAGHPIVKGASGYNVRIGDKIWSYKHPDFIKAFNESKPGWLRYWSGTAGDAFCSGTGMYDKEYINMFDKGESYDKLYDYVEIKGPHRITDLYSLMRKTGCKLVITINAFTETPEMTEELAQFCKNNHIKVEAWQFCNEPYFYVPGRQRYWWNDGYDYAQKMKPHAEAIQKVFPNAQLALNFTWDGIWTFMKEINQYQKSKQAFWNVFSKHSYAPHTGKDESFEEAYKRMNTKLLEVTSPEAMQEIEAYTQKDIPMIMTEFGVWNKSLNGIMSGVYNAEYTLRQLQHSNTWLIASHEISNKVKPKQNYQKEIQAAIENKLPLNTIEMATGVEIDIEGKALQLVHEATNNANYVYQTKVSGETTVPALEKQEVSGMYAMAFKGIDGEDFLIVTNRSSKWHNFKLYEDNKPLKTIFKTKYLDAPSLKSLDATIKEETIKSDGEVLVRPNTVLLMTWKNTRPIEIQPTRIYSLKVQQNGVLLAWTPQKSATAYWLTFQEKGSKKSIKKRILGSQTDTYLFTEALLGKNYQVSIQPENKIGKAIQSEKLSFTFSKPNAPTIFKIAPRDNQATVFWHSVENANSYKVVVTDKKGTFNKAYFADNVFGLKVYDLPLNTPLQAKVIAINGLSESLPSLSVDFVCKENIPMPPTNISAIEQNDGKIALHWNAPKAEVPNIKYNLLRGEKPHQFQLLKKGLNTTDFIDSTVQNDKEYFYTVKSYNENGECSFYPNIATIIRNTAQVKLGIISILATQGDSIAVQVAFSNIAIDGEIKAGLLISDVSFLNGEETKLMATKIENGFFTVKIPKASLSKATYSIKAFLQTNGGSTVLSLPPHKEYRNK